MKCFVPIRRKANHTSMWSASMVSYTQSSMSNKFLQFPFVTKSQFMSKYESWCVFYGAKASIIFCLYNSLCKLYYRLASCSEYIGNFNNIK